MALGRGVCGHRQVARQPDQPRQPAAVAQPGTQRDGATLREARQHDPLGRHAARHLALEQRVHASEAVAQAGLVFVAAEGVGRAGARVDVVPRAHRVAAVDGHGPHRRARDHPAHGADGLEPHLVGKRETVSAVGTQAVQHHDGGARRGGGVQLDGLQWRRHGNRG
jgi:hypothetical protein